MSGSNNRWRPLQFLLAGLAVSAALGATGCQVDVGGQTLPSPYYMSDDVQYFPPGPDFKLAREAAALQAAKATQQAPPQAPPAR
jgi:hypothetical protein